MTNLTAVSLFAGIGGFDLALERAGVDVVAAVEIDQAARGVLADRFPETILFDDVCEVTGDQLRAAGFVPERGILTAGFPCQDLSVAGRRGGLGKGTRSGLYWEVDRLLAELRPAWVILENVPGLLSAVCPDPDTRSAGDPLEYAAERFDFANDLMLSDDELAAKQGPGACEGGCFPAHGGAMGLVLGSLADRGYGFAYRVLDAQYTGVPQRRRRVIIVGRAGADARGPVEVLLEPEGRKGDSPAGRAPRADVAGTLGSRVGGSRTTDLDGHGAYIVNSLTTSSIGGIGGPDDNSAQAGHLVAAAITAREGKGPDSDATTTLLAFDAAQITSADDRSNPQPGDPAPSLASTGRRDPVYPVAWRGRGMELGQPEIANALRSAGDGHVGDQVGYVMQNVAVRRLTPLECERLQGFPDRHTATSNGKPQADAARYRQCGNAVAVPVVQWVVDRTVAVAAEQQISSEPAA